MIVGSQPMEAERRRKLRYPLDLTIRFRSTSAETPFSGKGWAVNMSSGGVLVASKNPFIVGTLVEMSIEWPSRLEGRIPLQLIATGRVLRGGASFFAASFERHEFRTRNKPAARSRGHIIEQPPAGLLPG
jgi:hypothetical protein